MSSTHKVILKILFLIVVPTLFFVVWSKPARVKVKRPPRPAESFTAPAVTTPYIADADLVDPYLWTVDDHGSLIRFSSYGPQSMSKLEGFGTGTNISFIDLLNGWAFLPTESVPTLLRTSDGGKSWQEVTGGTIPKGLTQPRRLKFFDQKKGWCADGSHIWRTTDGGSHWEEVFSTNGPVPWIDDLAFFDARTVMVAQSDGRFLTTSDAGKTWRLSEAGGFHLLATNRQIVWGVGPDNTIFQSHNSGRTWVELARIYSTATVLSMQFISKSEGWAAGYIPRASGGNSLAPQGLGVLFHTEDGGRTWESLTVPVDVNFGRVAFLDSKSGWLIGYNGLYHTKDGGATWESLILRTTQVAVETTN